jgi:hypothetical protein
MTISGQFSCPPPGSFVAVSGNFLVAAVMPASWSQDDATLMVPLDGSVRVQFPYGVGLR